MTFSIVARCAKTGQFGMAISSSSPAVAARCAQMQATYGACCKVLPGYTPPPLDSRVLPRQRP